MLFWELLVLGSVYEVMVVSVSEVLVYTSVASSMLCFLYDKSQTYAIVTIFEQVDLLKGQKTERVDVSLQPEELDALENVLPAK